MLTNSIVSILRADFKNRAYSDLESTILSMQIPRDPVQSDVILNVVLDCRFANVNEEHSKDWTQLDSDFSDIGSMISKAQLLFGFNGREDMVWFAETILEKRMPSVSRIATVHYSLYRDECANNIQDEGKQRGGWYRASLDSEDLTGTPFSSQPVSPHIYRCDVGTATADLAKVYP